MSVSIADGGLRKIWVTAQEGTYSITQSELRIATLKAFPGHFSTA